MPVALITGANKGLGLETARQLGKQSITVLLGARDLAKGQQAADQLRKESIDAHAIQLDVTSADSIATAVRTVQDKHGQLDILINNAGVMDSSSDGASSKVPVSTFRTTYETNVFGVVAVTQAFLPLLQKSPSARIVNLSSILGSVAEHSDPNSPIYRNHYTAYDTSKAALNLYTNHLALELRDTKIKVNAAHPGWVKTDMGGQGAQLEIPDGAKTAVMLATIPDNGPSGGFFHMGVHMRW